MANQQTSKGSDPSFVERIDVISNKDGQSTSITGGLVNLMYYESIMKDSVRATVTFVDAGNTINGKTALDGLPIVGEEKVFLKFTDHNDVTLDFGDKLQNHFYVNKVTPLSDDTTKSSVRLELASKEYILNEKVRLNNRFDGKVSEHIKRILTDKNYLATEKKLDIETTSNNYNFIGNNRKPYYALNWLSKNAVSAQNQKKGSSSGYFFFETFEGFKFKSIDGLLSQEKKKSIIFNQSPDSRGQNIPEGYDMKALEYSKDNAIDVQKKLQMGAFSTRTILFDPFSCFYQVITPSADQKKDSYKTAGKDLPKLNDEFNRPGNNKEFSRTTYMLLDKGTLPTGSGKGKNSEQIKKSGEQNFEPQSTLNQSIMRYNQMYSQKSNITIPGDFSLHAGDVIFLDAPELQTDTKNDEINKQNGGLYIIADLCHYITPKETYTKLNLVRDSFGRTGNHS
tara:strand:- start:3329 stop:4684 length:1356 start_codon:yes stop_codon:yes gene_type:complete